MYGENGAADAHRSSPHSCASIGSSTDSAAELSRPSGRGRPADPAVPTDASWSGAARRCRQPARSCSRNLPPKPANPFRAERPSTTRRRRTRSRAGARQDPVDRHGRIEPNCWQHRAATSSSSTGVSCARRGARRTRHRPRSRVHLTAPQAQALVGDVAAITQALVVLDQRYRNTPGWEPLAQNARLGWAALAAALDVNLGQPDYTVDHTGWRPRTKLIRRSGQARDPRRPPGRAQPDRPPEDVPERHEPAPRRRLPATAHLADSRPRGAD